ncbi:MAG: ANTAR domain-containing response regulator [Lactovum sp.]
MKGRIVVVDDESLVRLDFAEYLEENGYEVVAEASNGLEAVKICEKTRPDVVLMDIEMPILDGFSAAKKIIGNNYVKGGIVFLSAYSSKEHVQKASTLGACGYLVKPLDEKSLIPTIEIALERGKESFRLNSEINKLETKLEDRKIIDRAKGILMTRDQLTEQEAFNQMRTNSMKYRITLREFADMILESTES